MKKKHIASMLAGMMCFTLLCSVGSTVYIVKHMQKDSDTLKKEILADVDNKIETNLSNISTMSDSEKEAFRNSIVADLRDEFAVEPESTEDTNPVNYNYTTKNYITKTYPETIINNTYTTTSADDTNTPQNSTSNTTPPSGGSHSSGSSSGSSSSGSSSYPNFNDGSLIPVDIELPLELHPYDELTMTITNFTVEVYHHDGDSVGKPPYNLKFTVSGTFDSPDNVSYGFSKFPISILCKSDGHNLTIKGPKLDYTTKTFTCENTIQVEDMPKSLQVTK